MRMALGSLLMAVIAIVAVRADEEKVGVDKVPAPAMNAVKKRFPDAKVEAASKEVEGGKTLYEVTCKLNGKTVEVTVTPEGGIVSIEKEIDVKDLPKVVKAGFDAKSPNAKIKLVEEVFHINDGKESLDYYEFHLDGPNGTEVEVLITPAGKVHEEKPAAK